MSQDLQLILPELILAAGICLLLLFDLVVPRRRAWESGTFALGVLAVVGSLLIGRLSAEPARAFGMLQIDAFGAIFQLAITLAAAVAIFLNLHQHRFPSDRGRMESQFLLLCATLGGFVVVGTDHLMMFYLGLEMLSLCSYVLADVHKRDRAGAEASMKYVVYGALASAIMLYGFSLWFGIGQASFDFDDIARGVNAALLNGHAGEVMLATVLVLCGLMFKLSLAPFHWWAPDVYQGTTTPVACFLAVGSKLVVLGAALRLLGTVFASGMVGVQSDPLLQPVTQLASDFAGELTVILAALAALSMLWGNLAALGQTHLRRLLAYSSVGHAGYILAGISLMSPEGFHAAMIYALAYGIGLLAAFSAIFVLASRAGSDDFQDWRGLGWKYPLPAAVLVIAFASLIGLPPTGGFAAKWQLLATLWGGGSTGLAMLLVLLSLLSLYYSFRVVQALYLETPTAHREPVVTQRMPLLAAWLVVSSVAIFGMLSWGRVDVFTRVWQP